MCLQVPAICRFQACDCQTSYNILAHASSSTCSYERFRKAKSVAYRLCSSSSGDGPLSNSQLHAAIRRASFRHEFEKTSMRWSAAPLILKLGCLLHFVDEVLVYYCVCTMGNNVVRTCISFFTTPWFQSCLLGQSSDCRHLLRTVCVCMWSCWEPPWIIESNYYWPLHLTEGNSIVYSVCKCSLSVLISSLIYSTNWQPLKLAIKLCVHAHDVRSVCHVPCSSAISSNISTVQYPEYFSPATTHNATLL